MKKILLIICAAVLRLLDGKMERLKVLTLTILPLTILLLINGCGESSEVQEVKTLNAIKITVGDKTFTATLEDNPSARAFVETFPLEVVMNELNGNEKFVYLDRDLPNAPTNVRQIHAGDLMLFGSNCVVIFYKDFSTSYSYTRLGKLEDTADLEKVLGAGDVHVKFEK